MERPTFAIHAEVWSVGEGRCRKAAEWFLAAQASRDVCLDARILERLHVRVLA
ncbi:MAG: hypothetical protein ACO3QC_01130 [Phycisphaerales bacterium]